MSSVRGWRRQRFFWRAAVKKWFPRACHISSIQLSVPSSRGQLTAVAATYIRRQRKVSRALGEDSSRRRLASGLEIPFFEDVDEEPRREGPTDTTTIVEESRPASTTAPSGPDTPEFPARINANRVAEDFEGGAEEPFGVNNVFDGPLTGELSMDVGRHALDNVSEEKYSLIFYLTASTARARVVLEEGTRTRILATVADAHFGGKNFTDKIVEHFKEVWMTDHGTHMNCTALRRLRRACERAKCSLSSRPKVTIQLDVLVAGEDFEYTFTRDQFTAINRDNFQWCLTLVQKVLADANVSKEIIQEVMFIGRPTHMPELRDMLKRFFS